VAPALLTHQRLLSC